MGRAIDIPETTRTWVRSPSGAILVLCIFYAIGILGVLLPVHPDFLRLTPFNLLLSLTLVLWHHPDWSRRSVFFLGLCYLTGFFAELIGVQTGLLFGNYTYGPVLGPKLWGTPLMIGVNWMLLTYAAGVTVNHLLPAQPWLLRAVIAAGLMVALDGCIEPVAMHYDFWQWAGNAVPLRNYLGWFAVALPLQVLFMRWHPHTRNKVGVALFILQFLFFLILGILLIK